MDESSYTIGQNMRNCVILEPLRVKIIKINILTLFCPEILKFGTKSGLKNFQLLTKKSVNSWDACFSKLPLILIVML